MAGSSSLFSISVSGITRWSDQHRRPTCGLRLGMEGNCDAPANRRRRPRWWRSAMRELNVRDCRYGYEIVEFFEDRDRRRGVGGDPLAEAGIPNSDWGRNAPFFLSQ